MDEREFAELFTKLQLEVVNVVERLVPLVPRSRLEELYAGLWITITHRMEKGPIRLKTLRSYLITSLKHAAYGEKKKEPVLTCSLHDPGVMAEIDLTHTTHQTHENLEGEEPDRLEYVLAGLSPRYRELAIRHCIEGVSQKQLAQEMGISERRVCGIMHVIKAILRSRYKTVGITKRNQQLYTVRRRG